jgi:hypothetical protein
MTEHRPPYGHAAGAAGMALLLYALTLAPTTWFWDTSEYIATAHILGIPHPPGNPLFVVVGKVWSLLLGVTGLPLAVRINLLAAVTSALATGFFFLVAHRVLKGWLERDGGVREAWRVRLPLAGAWAGALLGATAYTVWNQSNVNEKVYTLSVLGIAAVAWLAVRWLDRKDEPGAWWYLVLAVYVMVLGSTNHLMALLPAPALGLLVLVEKPRILLDRRVLARGVLAVVLGLSFNFFLPLRSAQQPMINEGEPVCESLAGAAVAIYTNGRAGCPALAANLTREQYQKPSIFVDPASDPFNPRPRSAALLGHQFLNYFQYFDWQWARGLAASPLPGNARLPVSLLFLGLGIWGLVLSRRSARGHVLFLGTLAATLTVGLVYYLNFRYGYSLGAGLPGVDRGMQEVRERDYFFIASFHLWGFLAGVGLVGAWRWAAGTVPENRAFALASPVLAVALVPLVFNWGWADRSDDHSARDWAYNLLESVEPYGILFTNGDNDTFPLWYLQEVEGIRQDVTVIVVQYLYTQWYPRQLRYHTSQERQRPFRVEASPGVYDPPDAPPARALTVLSDEDLNRIVSGTLAQDFAVNLVRVAVRYPEGTFLGRGERIALAIIRDSLEHRPIHFASTGGLAQALGLDRWAVRQGLSARLRIEELEEAEDVVRVSSNLGGEWIDLDTSLRLTRDVHTYRGFRDRDIWADRPTLNIPWQFYFLYLQMADAVIQLEMDDALAEELIQRADEFMTTARGGLRGAPDV